MDAKEDEVKPLLADLLPQADGMILLTDYDPPAGDGSVLAFVSITPASAFYEADIGGVPSCVALEYMAQAMALATGFYRRAKGLPPKIGFLLGSRRLAVSIPHFRNGETYGVRAACIYNDESFGSFDCTISDSAGAEVDSGTLTAFQPEGDVDSETLEEYR